MKNSQFDDVAVIVLAAGKGTRLNMPNGRNKTTLEVKGKPMIQSTIEIIEQLGVGQIIAVVGHGKQSIIELLGRRVDYANQTKRMGTGHAAWCGIKKINSGIKYAVVVYGDDSHSYHPEMYLNLIDACKKDNNDMAFVVMHLDNPYGLGRIIRDEMKNILKVTEEKNATEKEKMIKEVNAGAYCFKREFASKYLPMIKINPLKMEKYLTDIIEIALVNRKKIAAVKLNDSSQWCGINTMEELLKANNI